MKNLNCQSPFFAFSKLDLQKKSHRTKCAHQWSLERPTILRILSKYFPQKIDGITLKFNYIFTKMIKVQTIFKIWYLFSSNKKFYLYWSNNLRNKPGKKIHLMADKDNHLINLFLEIQSSCSLILDKWLYGRFLFTPSQYL